MSKVCGACRCTSAECQQVHALVSAAVNALTNYKVVYYQPTHFWPRCNSTGCRKIHKIGQVLSAQRWESQNFKKQLLQLLEQIMRFLCTQNARFNFFVFNLNASCCTINFMYYHFIIFAYKYIKNRFMKRYSRWCDFVHVYPSAAPRLLHTPNSCSVVVCGCVHRHQIDNPFQFLCSVHLFLFLFWNIIIQEYVTFVTITLRCKE